MKTLPPLLTGGALLLWGWQTGQLFWALPMALFLEIPPRLPWRRDPSTRGLYRLADLCSVLLGLVTLYALLGQTEAHAVVALTRLMPIALFPLMVALANQEAATIPAGVLFLSLRRGERAGRVKSLGLDMLFTLYGGLCVLAAGAGLERDPRYFPLAAAWLVWALWPHRPPRQRWGVWAGTILLAVGLGFAIQLGLVRLQEVLTDRFLAWYQEWMVGGRDPYRASTAFGRIGQLEDSGTILFRVRPPATVDPPVLLREGIYQVFLGSDWSAATTRFHPLSPPGPATRWQREGAPPPGRGQEGELQLFMAFNAPDVVLPLPAGWHELRDLPADQLLVSQFGVVKAMGVAGYAPYRVRYAPDRAPDAPPDHLDLLVPLGEGETLDRVLKEAGVAPDQPRRQQLARLSRLLRREFRYTLRSASIPPGRTALATFLLERRAGHCEYFATALTLLLRRAGIPARYVVGYSAQEYDPESGLFIVRQRHAHAWVSVHLGEAWEEADPTPPEWGALENREEHPRWRELADAWYRGVERWHGWWWRHRHGAGAGAEREWLLAAAALLLGVLGWRSRRHWRRRSPRPAPACGGPLPPRPPSPFDPLVARLEREVDPRGVGEPLLLWLRRIGHPELEPLALLHYRWILDPQDGGRERREALTAEVARWLEEHPRR